MSLAVPNVGGTLTGGTSKTLTYIGSPVLGKSSYLVGGSSVLAPRSVDFTQSVVKASASDIGRIKAGVKVQGTNRLESEGCCSTTVGSVIADLSLSWNLSMPESLFDEEYDLLVAILADPATKAAVKDGTLGTVR